MVKVMGVVMVIAGSAALGLSTGVSAAPTGSAAQRSIRDVAGSERIGFFQTTPWCYRSECTSSEFP
jgi:hypothetical protein